MFDAEHCLMCKNLILGRAPNAEEGGNWKTINTRKSQTQASSQGQSMDWNKFTDKMKESLSANVS